MYVHQIKGLNWKNTKPQITTQKVYPFPNGGVLKFPFINAQEVTDEALETGNKQYYKINLTTIIITTIGFPGYWYLA